MPDSAPLIERPDFYIGGAWVPSQGSDTLEVIDPSTEKPIARIALGSATDVDRAVHAARKAFDSFSQTTREDRLALLESIVEVYKRHLDKMAQTISREMGAPLWLSKAAQAAAGLGHLMQTLEVLRSYPFEELRGTTLICREPIGVCGFITPWNWPINQIMCKVAPALAAGCTMVLKPSEISPLNAILLAEIFHEAGVPSGVFNLVNGQGATVGQAIASHPEVDMVSFTGSTRAGIEVARSAAHTVKRVTQELGGKSANVILEDADLTAAVRSGVTGCTLNSGQSCNAPTRMLVPKSHHEEAVEIAKTAMQELVVGDPFAEGTRLGPVVSEVHWHKIQGLIQQGIDEGATLVVGGLGRPEGLDRGYYVRPTLFANVKNDMSIAREEIFGPVLSILPYADEDDAVRIANETVYGLAGYVSSGDLEHAQNLARRLRCGQIALNGASSDFADPFGGFKQSGNGREWGLFGFEEFLETKAVIGWMTS